jgi:hypothetical protein
MRIHSTVVACALVASLPASAVYLNPDGKGQALIFPYYTARSANANPFNTYLSLVNHTSDAKAIRVRVREGRNASEVAGFNLFLSPNDMWTGAVLPVASSDAARLISKDLSCTSPAFAALGAEPPAIAFSNASYVGDSFGDGMDRTREGWVEVIEMATLTGASAAAIAHGTNGVPVNCAAVQGTPALSLAAPTGGLSGTLTLINVTSGEDFTVNAEALAGLSTAPFYRHAADSYPDFNAAEIDPVSVVVADGFVYRSVWSRGADAVSATLMRSSWQGEYILDAETNSQSDFVVTFPTRHHYVAGGMVAPPFGARCQSPSQTFSGELVRVFGFTREAEGGEIGAVDHPVYNEWDSYECGAAVVFGVNSYSYSAPSDPPRVPTQVLGSLSRAFVLSGRFVPSPNGWLGIATYSGLSLTSIPTSTRMNVATGSTTTGAHRYAGLPIVGFTVRTFQNGTLICSNGACQGNYGGAFPLKFDRTITLVP